MNKTKYIADPWYSGDFDTTYDEIYEGCRGVIDYIVNENIDPLAVNQKHY
ncbi:hypothetical protein [Clostridium sp. DL-VIII]|nr:hypothetical protein [Clostridium sp. DL-VIII]